MIKYKNFKINKLNIESLTEYTIIAFIILWIVTPIIVGIFSKIDFIQYCNLFSSIQYKIGYLGIAILLLCVLKKSRNNTLFVMDTVDNNLEVLIVSAMLVWSFISALNAKDRQISFLGDMYRLEGFLRYISYAGFFILGYLTKKEKDIKFCFNMFIVIGVILSLNSVIRGFVNIYSINCLKVDTSVFLNTNHYAYYLTMVIICISAVWLINKNKKLNIAYFVSFLICSTALILNNTFGCYLAVIFGLIFVIIAFKICNRNVLKKSILIFMLFLSISFILDYKYSIVRRNFMEIRNSIIMIAKNDDRAIEAGSHRWELWKYGVKFISYNPILGQGPDSLGVTYSACGVYYNDRPHNIFIQLGASLGIPCLLMYIALLICVYSKNLKIRKKIMDSSLVSICVTVAYLMSSCFGNSMYYTTPYYIVFLGICSRHKLQSSF